MDLRNKVVRVPSKIIIPIIAFIIGLVFFCIGAFEYGFWDSVGQKPTKGFFPVIIAVALMALSVLAFIKGLRDKQKMVEFRLENWLVPIALILMILSSMVFGLILTVAAFIILWLKVYEKQSWKIVLIALLIVLFIVVGCFNIWLGIDFPMGIILDMIIG